MNKAVGIGACVMDTLINVPNYPKEDTKMRAESSKQAGGGPVATGLVAAARLGAEAEYIGVLSDDAGGLYDNVESLLPYADILIPSEEFALGITGEKKAENAAKRLYEKYNPDVVVITQGKNGGTLYDGTRLTAYPAFSVKAADTNGAGDVFHGAFAAGYLKGYDFLKCCYFASAVSAVKCTGVGARESVPDFETVKKFLEENGYEL